MVEVCDNVPADGLCGVIPCSLCLEWETYTGIEYGSADFATSSWTGTVGGIAFTSYWERNASGIGEYVVTFGGYEVYRATCYEGASCRNPSGEVAATVGTESGTLRWSVYEPRELELIDDPVTGCRDFFCDSCRCSCDCLCVTITEASATITGEICDVAYQCDPPLWAGTIGYYELSLQLGRDASGTCIITPTVNGDELEPVAFPGCASGAATITLYDGTTIAVRCKKCACSTPTLCCGGRNLDGTLYLKLEYPGTSAMVDCGDSLITLTDNGSGLWTGNGTVQVEIPSGGGEECVPIVAYFEFYCDEAGPVYEMRWRFTYLGTEYPEDPNGSDPDENGKRWCGLIRISEDCDYPFLGKWDDNDACAMKFWNSFFTFWASEVPW